jgi:hypothetical protein
MFWLRRLTSLRRQRVIPDASCVLQHILVPAGQQSDYGVLHESWQTSNSIRTPKKKGPANAGLKASSTRSTRTIHYESRYE